MVSATEGEVQANSRFRKPGQCSLCRRQTLLTFHHLIPRKLHRRTYFQKNYSREQLARGIFVCTLCHKGIHKTYDEMSLGRRFASPELLLQDEALQRHFSWVARQRTRQPDA